MTSQNDRHMTNHAGDCIPMCPACRPAAQNGPVMSRGACTHGMKRAKALCPWCALEAEQFNHAGTREHLRLAREEIATLEARIYQLNAASGKTGPV
jgi:hypothetical protein